METTNLPPGGQALDRPPLFAGALGFIVVFAAIFRGAHDLWASTLVYLSTLFLGVCLLIAATRRHNEKIRFSMGVPLLFFGAAVFVSFVRSSNPSESFLAFMDVCTAMLTFLISVNVLRSLRARSVFLAWMVPCLWFECALTVASVIASQRVEVSKIFISSHPMLMYFMPIPEIYDVEKMGSVINANLLSVFVLPLFILLVAKAIEGRFGSKTLLSFWISGAGSAFVCLVLSRSGSSWMSLLIALFAVGAWFHGGELARRHKKLVFAALGLGLVALSAMLLYKFMHKVDLSIDPHRNNLNRLYWWGSALQMFADHPWTGVGAGNYGSAYLSYKIGGTENTLYAHGFPFTLLAETGLFGVLTFLFLLVAFVRVTLFLTPRRLREHPYLLALLAVSLFYVINIGLEYLLNLLVFAVLAGMTAAKAPAMSWKPRSSAVIIVSALAVGAVPFLVSPFFASRSAVAGNLALEAGDTTQAQKYFKDAIELDPRAWEPYVGLARIANKQGDAAAAVDWQQQALLRNKLSLPLRRELETYQRLER